MVFPGAATIPPFQRHFTTAAATFVLGGQCSPFVPRAILVASRLATNIMIRKEMKMTMGIGEVARVLPGLVVVVFALNGTLPARADSCNAVQWEQQSLTLRWDDKTVANCLIPDP
jgi:hypothetical protein